jgi:hypothetical protein
VAVDRGRLSEPHETSLVDARLLEQAGLHPTFVKLAEAGIRGNGHMMMIEKNNHEIAALIDRWLDKSVSRQR